MTVSASRATPSLDRLERDARGVGALGTADHLDTDPLAPGGELVDGGGAERVGCAEDHVAVLGDEDPGDLADRGRLAGAVDADHQDDAGLPVGTADLEAPVHGRVDQGDELLAQHGPGVGRRALHPQPGAQPLDQLLGRHDTDVGGQQGVLDGLPGVLVEAVAAQQGRQAAAQAALRAGQPLAQPDQPGGGALGLLQGRSGRCLRLELDRDLGSGLGLDGRRRRAQLDRGAPGVAGGFPRTSVWVFGSGPGLRRRVTTRPATVATRANATSATIRTRRATASMPTSNQAGRRE